MIPLFLLLLAGGIAVASHGVGSVLEGARRTPAVIGAGGGRKRRLAALRARPWNDLTESERLELLTPDTQKVAVEMIRRLKALGLDARLGETYRDEEGQRAKFEAGKSSIRDLGWHTMGKAFHIIIVGPDGKVLESAYPTAGKLATELGAIWKGDQILHNKYGQEYRDLAHFEYHPGVTLAMARRQAGVYA